MSSLPAATELLDKSSGDLDRLYWSSSSGPMPDGDGNGTVLIATGTMLGRIIVQASRAVARQGKVFEAKNGILCNKVSPFRARAISASPTSRNGHAKSKRRMTETATVSTSRSACTPKSVRRICLQRLRSSASSSRCPRAGSTATGSSAPPTPSRSKAGLDWIEDNTMTSVLLRHYPALRHTLDSVPNAFTPWTRPKR